MARPRARPPTPAPSARAALRHDIDDPRSLQAGLRRLTRRLWPLILRIRLPRGVGLGAAALFIATSIIYGTIVGNHLPTIVAVITYARDEAANAAGFRVIAVSLSGDAQVSREEVLAIAGVGGRTSLLFLDVEATREALRTNPWIADASVLKLYPGELKIGISERKAFALWQKDKRISVIAADGTVLESFPLPGLGPLPLVVGEGADQRAQAFLTLLERYPSIREQVGASILVGERRWNLRLHNGLDVRLPETDVAGALDRLVALDREVKLLSRDITAIDLRLADRVTVRLSPAAAQARWDALNEKKPPAKKGGPA